MKNPLAPIAIAFLVGITVAYLKIPLVLDFVLLGFLLLGCFIGRRERWLDGSFVLLFFLLGFLRYWTHVILPQEHTAFLASETPKEVWLVGRIQSEVTDRFVLSAERISFGNEWLPTMGKMLVRSPERKYRYGDRIFIQGELSLPSEARNPGEWSYRKYLAVQGIHALFRLKQEPVLVEKNKGFSLWKLAYGLKGFLRQRIQNALAPQEQGLIQGLLLGERGTIPFELKQAFVQTGTVHILAISGLHIGMIVWGLLFLLKFFRVPRKPRFLMAMVGIWIYALVAGAGASVTRSTVMAEIYLLGKFLGRSNVLLNSLFTAILAILVWNPLQIFDLGFWLSVLSVLALILVYPLFHPLIENYPKIAKEAAALLLITLSVLIVITPIVSYHFNLFYPVTFLANLAVIPLSSLLLSTGFLAAFLGTLGNWLWPDLRFLEAIFTWIVEKCAQIPGGFWLVPRLPVWILVLYYGLLLFIRVIPCDPFQRIPKLLILWLFFLNLLFWFPLVSTSPTLGVTFFDVGHGDAALVEFPKGETLLIDTGKEQYGNKRNHPVLTYLKMRGIRFLDGVVLSHGDQDHIGAFETIRKEIRVAQLWDNGFKDSATLFYREFFKKRQAYQTLNKGERLMTVSGIVMECLNPPSKGLDQFTQRNDASVVLNLTYQHHSVLFTGDVEGKGIGQLLELPPEQLTCTFLKVPHHGSDLGRGGGLFFSRTQAQMALISMAVPNQWGLPNAETMDQLRECGARCFLTAEEGAVCFQSDGKSDRVNSLRKRENLWYTISILKKGIH